MVSLLFLLLIPALIGVVIFGVSLLFSHPSAKASDTPQSPGLATTGHVAFKPSITSPKVFSLVPSPTSEIHSKGNPTPLTLSHPAVVAVVENGKDDGKHGTNKDNDDDDDDDDDDEGDDDEDSKHKVDKKKLADMSESSALVRSIAEGGILTGEEELQVESAEVGESNLTTSKEELEEDDADDEDDINDQARRTVNPSKGKKSQQRHHHHRATQKWAPSKLLRRNRIAIGVNVPHAPAQPNPLHPTENDVESQESINDFEEESKETQPSLTFKEIIAIARSAKVQDPVKTMYPLQTKQEKRKPKKSADTTPMTYKKQAKATKGKEGKKETKNKDKARAEDLEAAINAIVGEQSDALQRALSQIANKIAKNPELEQHKDVLEYLSNAKIRAEEELDLESFTSSKIMEQERDLGQKDQRILLFRNPKAVSRAEAIFSSQKSDPTPIKNEVSETPTPSPAPPSPVVTFLLKILNVLAPPFILQLRSDLRNLLFWLCAPNPGPHIDGKNADGDDTISRQLAAEDRATLVHPDGSVDFKDIWDVRLGPMVLGCLKNHWSVFLKEILELFWKRFTYVKEFLIDQLRSLIGLPKYMVPFILGALDNLHANDLESPKVASLHPASQQRNEGIFTEKTTELEFMMKMYVSPPPVSAAFQPITKTIVYPSPGQEPIQMRLSRRPHGVQRAELGNDFASWIVDTIFTELGSFFDAAKQADTLKPSEGDVFGNQSRMETDGSGGDQQCLWMKERVVKALTESFETM